MGHTGSTNHEQQARGVRRYYRPQLMVYGALTDLTASGSGPAESDAGSMSGMTCLPGNMTHPNCPAP